jgi:hypothetical protein
LFGIYIYLLALYIFNIAVVIVSVKEPLSAFDALVVFALPFYQGLMMRCVRIYAFACEIFLHSSHHDDYVPERIRRALYGKLTHAYK